MERSAASRLFPPGLVGIAEIILEREPFQLFRKTFQIRQFYGGDGFGKRVSPRSGKRFLRQIEHKGQVRQAEPL